MPMPGQPPPIRDRLRIDPDVYIKFINQSEKTRFGNFMGPKEAMRGLSERFGKSLLKGQTTATQLLTRLVYHPSVARGCQVL